MANAPSITGLAVSIMACTPDILWTLLNTLDKEPSTRSLVPIIATRAPNIMVQSMKMVKKAPQIRKYHKTIMAFHKLDRAVLSFCIWSFGESMFCHFCGINSGSSEPIQWHGNFLPIVSAADGDKTTKVDYLPSAKVLYKERNGFKRFRGVNGSTLLSRS